MMTNRTMTLAAAAVALALVGCSNRQSTYRPVQEKEKPPVTVDATNGPTFMPLTEGNQWTYVANTVLTAANGASQSNSSELTLVVRNVSEVDGARRAAIDVVNRADVENAEFLGQEPPAARDATGWMINADGIFQTAATGRLVQYTPPLPALLFAAKPGDETTYSGTGIRPFGGIGPFNARIIALGSQEVDGVNQSFVAWGVRTINTYQIGQAPPTFDVPAFAGGGSASAESATSTNEPASNAPSNEPALNAESSTPTTNGPTGGNVANAAPATNGEGATTPTAPAGNSAQALPPNTVVTESVIYYAPGIGIVRYRQVIRTPSGETISQTLRLKDYTVK
jgi:uncharacterized lipoprotein NlpE involved in copper resistance